MENSAKIIACYNTGNIYSSEEDSGGICGCMQGPAKIEDCFNSGNVSGNRSGGICGWSGWHKPELEIFNCTNIGKIEADIVGGICGVVCGTCIKNCYNAGVTEALNFPKTSGEIAAIEDVSKYQSSISHVVDCYYNDAISKSHKAVGKN